MRNDFYYYKQSGNIIQNSFLQNINNCTDLNFEKNKKQKKKKTTHAYKKDKINVLRE